MPQATASDRIEKLRRRIARIEQNGRGAGASMLPFGVAAIDAHLPGGGLLLGALHEVSGLGPDLEDGAVPAAFIAGIAARIDPTKPVLWCQAAMNGDLYGPGLAACGLGPERLVLARARTETDLLWAMEEGLRNRALAAVVGELAELPGPASRRLQLAAEASGVTAFALRRVRSVRAPGKNENSRTNPIGLKNKAKIFGPTPLSAAPNAAMTRWRVAALRSNILDEELEYNPLWKIDLFRARGAAPAVWIVEACDATGHVALPAALGDGAARRGRTA
jgi:protein ImuA